MPFVEYFQYFTENVKIFKMALALVIFRTKIRLNLNAFHLENMFNISVKTYVFLRYNALVDLWSSPGRNSVFAERTFVDLISSVRFCLIFFLPFEQNGVIILLIDCFLCIFNTFRQTNVNNTKKIIYYLFKYFFETTWLTFYKISSSVCLRTPTLNLNLNFWFF